jgi:hypothetical protein
MSSSRQPTPGMPSIITHWPIRKPSAGPRPGRAMDEAAVARELVGRVEVVVDDRDRDVDGDRLVVGRGRAQDRE